jgi:hypothetical protein
MFNTKIVRLALFITSASLAACSSGGSGSPPPIPVTPTSIPTSTPAPVKTATPIATATPVGASPTPKATATPTASPTGTPTPVSASASGTVVDFDTNIGLAGVSVAIAPYTHGAPANIVATTNANGAFSFTTAPGRYLLIIGNNNASDTRTTYHNDIVLTAGANALTQGVPLTEPEVTLTAAETSGNFRLATLSTVEQSCMSGMNAGRSANNLNTLVPDENGYEYVRAMNAEEEAQNTDTPSPLFNAGYMYNSFGNLSAFTGTRLYSCTEYTNTYDFTTGSVPNSTALNPSETWYAAEWNSQNLTAQLFLADPR